MTTGDGTSSIGTSSSNSDCPEIMEPPELDSAQATAVGRLLHFASQGDVEAVKMVLDDLPKVPVDSQDYDGRTAMHLAASEGHKGVIQELLLNRHANVNPVDRWRKTPLADARRYEAVNAKSSIKRQIYQEVCDFLVKHGGSTSSPFEIDDDELKYIQDIRKCDFGEIKLANWRGTIVQAKIMELTSPKSVDPNLTTQLSLLQRLRHPNIVQFLGAVQIKNKPLVLVTEYLPKGSLFDLLQESKKGRIPQKEAMSYALDIARGMNYLHQHKPEVVHCDLNPKNLLRDSGGHLKVAGLHLSEIEFICKHGNCNFIYQDPSPSPDMSHLAYYRAPELAGANPGKTPVGSVDVYSFGVIVREMFEGQSLASRQAQKAGASTEMRGATQDAATVRLYPSGMQKILQNCCDRDPEKRPRFEKIIEQLETINEAMLKKQFCGGLNTVMSNLSTRWQACIPKADWPNKQSSVFSVESQKGVKQIPTSASKEHTTCTAILE